MGHRGVSLSVVPAGDLLAAVNANAGFVSANRAVGIGFETKKPGVSNDVRAGWNVVPVDEIVAMHVKKSLQLRVHSLHPELLVW